MPWSRTQRSDGVIVTRCTGVTDLEAVLAAVRETPSLDSVRKSSELFEIVIYEEDSVRTVDYEQNQLVRADVLATLGWISRGAIAFVALSPTNYGAVRQFTLTMNDEPFPMAAFDDLDEAEAWLANRKAVPVRPR